MRDMDRPAATRLVYKRLADPTFRERLSASAPDGTRPVTVLMRHDLCRQMLEQVDAVGGASNVVVPMLNGIVVIALRSNVDVGHDGEAPAVLQPACSVGVFIHRLMQDSPEGGPVSYSFDTPTAEQRVEQKRAELVALGG